MPYLIDTDVIIYHLNGVPAATQLLRQLFPDRPAMSAITYMEVLDGIPQSLHPGRAELRFRVLSQRVPVLPVDEDVAAECARIRQALRGQGRSLRPRALDLLIGATALHYGLDVITNNPQDFRDIPGIVVTAAGITR